MTTEAQLLRLMTWFSPSFPVGSFSYSHGLEYAVEAGIVIDAQTLEAWVGHVVSHGAGYLDGVVVAATWDAVAGNDQTRFVKVAERSAANRATSEMALESHAQGASFIDAAKASWSTDGFEYWTEVLEAEGYSVTYPVAIGLTAAVHEIDRAATVLAYLHATTSNLVSAGMRLIPLGQSAGQSVIATLEDIVVQTQRRVLSTSLDEAGTAAPMVDWSSMQHETQYTRLFRS